MKKLRKNKKGFTLVELVVVIAILAVLASTATVATIAILNNARKSPVSDGASKIKDIVTNYNAMSSSDYPDNVDGFAKLLKETMPELADTGRVIKKASNQVAKTDASGDKIYIALPTTSGLKCRTQSWELVVFNEYFKCVVKINDGGTEGKITVGDVQKF